MTIALLEMMIGVKSKFKGQRSKRGQWFLDHHSRTVSAWTERDVMVAATANWFV